jgi:hypothetical protein
MRQITNARLHDYRYKTLDLASQSPAVIAPGTRTTTPGTRTTAPGTRITAPGTRTTTPGTRITPPGTRICPCVYIRSGKTGINARTRFARSRRYSIISGNLSSGPRTGLLKAKGVENALAQRFFVIEQRFVRGTAEKITRSAVGCRTLK